ncbi:MAG TPA: hypothetical protein ENN80_09415, partial [Candidatus Hydrogenedentes bacterium]|nr:hypothetical protein [Candidatus Hydrogenedentota bacterium]
MMEEPSASPAKRKRDRALGGLAARMWTVSVVLLTVLLALVAFGLHRARMRRAAQCTSCTFETPADGVLIVRFPKDRYLRSDLDWLG